MSMNRYANAGPIMAGLAAMSEPIDALYTEPPIDADDWGDIDPAPMMLDVWRGIQNIADQLSEVAAQMVDIRKRLDRMEADYLAHSKSWYGIEPLPAGFRDEWMQRWQITAPVY